MLRAFPRNRCVAEAQPGKWHRRQRRSARRRCGTGPRRERCPAAAWGWRCRAPRLLRTGDRVNVRGRAVGRRLWVTDIVAGLDQEGTGEPTETQAAAAAAQRRALLLVLNMPGDPDYYGAATVGSATGKMFLDGFSVDALYVETSFGQFGFPGPGVGDVFGPLDIPYFAGCPYPSALYWIANAADAAAADAGIDLSAYDNRFYLIPPKSISDCPWLAVGEVGFYGGTGVYRAWSTRNYTVAYAHELGHNLGWHHAAFDPDNDGVLVGRDGVYGDTSDIMGYCCSHRKFNSVHVDQIGWFDASPADIVTVLASGSYRITPLGSGNGFDPQILKIDKPDTNEVYYLSFRQPNGLDATISSTYTRGVNIHHARETGRWSYFIDALLNGESFVDAVNGVTVTQTGKNGDYVTVDVTFEDCVVADPTVSLAPPDQVSAGSDPVTYQVWVTNTDTALCDPAIFALSEDLGGLTGTLSPSQLDLAPGQTGSATLTADVAAALDGVYTLWVDAGDVAGLRNAVSASATLLIDSTAPLAPTGLSAVEKKIKGKLAVQLSWDAAADAEPGSGVVSYRLYRDGFAIADTSDLSYNDRNVASGSTYLYAVMSVDLVGLLSGLSDGLVYSSGGSSGGGSDDGGSTGGKGWGKGGKSK